MSSEKRKPDPARVANLRYLRPAVKAAVTAEGAVLAGVEAACTTAVGAYAAWRGADELELLAELSDHRGIDYARSSRQVRVTTSAEAEALGLAVARELLAG